MRLNKQAIALKALLMAGVPEDIALDMCGFKKGTKLNPMVIETNNSNNSDGKETKEIERQTYGLRKISS